MSSFQLFSLILGFSMCVLSSAFEYKEKASNQKEINTLSMKLSKLNDKMEQMEEKLSTGNCIKDLHEIKINVTKLINVIEQGFKANSRKIEKIEGFIEKINQKMHDTVDDVFSVYGSKCRSMCEVKGHSVANQAKAEVEHQLEQLESCLARHKQNIVNVCRPNPCNGGQCELNATGSGYNCSNCPNSTYGSHCQNEKCEKENRCVQYNNTVYVVFEDELSWAEADRKCLSEGMTLAMPEDRESNEFLRSQLRPIYGYDVIKKSVFLWLGLKYDASDEQWRWTNGSPLGNYTGGSGEFTGGFEFQACGFLYVDIGKEIWFPEACISQWFPLCEKRVLVN